MIRLFPLILFLLFSACQKTPHSEQNQEVQQVLRVGMFPNITHAQALVAANMTREGKGWFEQRLGVPVKIEWFVYNAGPSAMEGIFTQAVDMTYVGPSPALNAYARANGKEIRVVSGAVRGGDALVIRGDDIKTPADFRGKTIATPQLGNTQDIACRAWLIGNGIHVTLTGGDAKVVPTANPDIISLFKQGKINAAWTVEPWVSRLLSECGGKIFYEPSHSITTILVSSDGFLKNRPELAQKFIAAHRELTDWIKSHPEEAQRRVCDELSAIMHKQISIDVVRSAWNRLEFDNAISAEPFKKFIADALVAGLLQTNIDLSHFIILQP